MKNAGRWLVAIAVTVGLLWWALHGVDWTLMWRNVLGANPLLVLVAVAVSQLIYPLRAFRWRPILEPAAPGLTYDQLWRATAVGFMANFLLPFRPGELVRPFMLARETTVPFTTAFASQVVDRVFDALVVFMLVGLAMLDPRFPAAIGVRTFATLTAFGVAGVSVALYFMVFFPDRTIAFGGAAARRVLPRLEDRVRTMLRSFADGLAVLRDARRFALVFLWAMALWVTQALAFWIMFRAVGINAPFSAALLIQGLIVLAVSVPSTPGFFGAFEVAAVSGLAMYGVDRNLAVAWSLVFHVLSLLPISLIGLYYLARSGVSFSDLKRIRP